MAKESIEYMMKADYRTKLWVETFLALITSTPDNIAADRADAAVKRFDAVFIEMPGLKDGWISKKEAQRDHESPTQHLVPRDLCEQVPDRHMGRDTVPPPPKRKDRGRGQVPK